VKPVFGERENVDVFGAKTNGKHVHALLLEKGFPSY